eukprot:scaffold620838_cov22-Prasinocladus_malaysianus.AAC.1
MTMPQQSAEVNLYAYVSSLPQAAVRTKERLHTYWAHESAEGCSSLRHCTFDTATADNAYQYGPESCTGGK